MPENCKLEVHGVHIEVTPDGKVHVHGASHVTTYGPLRTTDQTCLATDVDNRCPNRTRGGQIVKFGHIKLPRGDRFPYFEPEGGEAATVNEVCHEGDNKGHAVIEVREEGSPGDSKPLTHVGKLNSVNTKLSINQLLLLCSTPTLQLPLSSRRLALGYIFLTINKRMRFVSFCMY
jgi:hypothetical protein